MVDQPDMILVRGHCRRDDIDGDVRVREMEDGSVALVVVVIVVIVDVPKIIVGRRKGRRRRRRANDGRLV